MEKPKRDIPPGLIRIIRGVKPSKKFYFLVIISIFLVLSGLGALYFYAYYLNSSKTNIFQTKPDTILTSEKPQESSQKSEAHKDPSDIKQDQKKDSEVSNNRELKRNRSIAKNELKNSKVEKTAEVNDKTKESSTILLESFRGADFLYRAKDFEQKGLFFEAIAEYKQYINHTGIGDGRILNKIATLYLIMGNLKEAEHYSELAIKDAQNNREILINYGVIKAKLGALNKAEESFMKVLSVEPENKTVLFNMALVKEKKGEYSEALIFYERLYGLGESSALFNIERLRSKR